MSTSNETNSTYEDDVQSCDNISISSSGGQPRNLKKKIGDFLNTFIKKRPSPDDLREKNILVAPSTVSPRIQPSRYDLENNMSGRNNNTAPTPVKTHQRKGSNSRGGKRDDQAKKSAWEYLRNLDFTFSKFTFGKTVVHRLKFPQFGISPDELQDLYPDQIDGIPAVLTKGMEYLRNHLDTEGLFRVNGSNKDISLLKFQVEDGDLNFSAVENPYCICGLISTFFKELPEPLIPCDRYNEAIDCVRSTESLDVIVPKFRKLVLNIPPSHLCILRKFIEFLKLIETHKEKNKMTSDNLGIIFGPTLMRDPDFKDITSGLNNLKLQSFVIKYLVECYHSIFKSHEVKSAYRKSMVAPPPVDTSSIDYLDIASPDNGKRESMVQIIRDGKTTFRPRPPPRRTGTILLSPRQPEMKQSYSTATMTRPMSRIFNPEILDSPAFTSPDCPRPPKPPSRKPAMTTPIKFDLNRPTTTTTTTTTTPLPLRRLPTPPNTPASPQLSNRPPPSKAPIPPKLPTTPNPTTNAETPKLKPVPPKRNMTVDSNVQSPPTTPLVMQRANTLPSKPVNVNTLPPPPSTTSSTPNLFDRPPNKPPPSPFDIKYKTTPAPLGQMSKQVSTSSDSINQPPQVKKRVQFGETTTSEISTSNNVPTTTTTTSNTINRPPTLPRSISFVDQQSKPIPVPRSNLTNELKDSFSQKGQSPKPTAPILNNNGNNNISPSSISNGSASTTPPNGGKSSSFKINEETEKAKNNFTQQRTSKSALNLTGNGVKEDRISPSTSPVISPFVLKNVQLIQPSLRMTQQQPPQQSPDVMKSPALSRK